MLMRFASLSLAVIFSLLMISKATAQPSLQIAGTVNFQLQHPATWAVTSASPAWESAPLFGCTTTLVSIFSFFDNCLFEDVNLRCTKTTCVSPIFADPFGGPTVTTTFSDECFYCIDHPECCGIGFSTTVPEYAEVDNLRVGLSGDNSVPVVLAYSLAPPGPLVDFRHEAMADVERTTTFRFTRPLGASGPASLVIPVDIDQLIVRAWQGAPLSISNGFAFFELRAQSPQLGNLFRLRVEQPVDGSATIIGMAPSSEFELDIAMSRLEDFAGVVPPILVPAVVNEVEITVTMSFSAQAEFDCDPFIRGDVNSDGAMNLGDIVTLLGYVFSSGPAPQPLAAGDVNGDGVVNVADAIYGLSHLFGGGPQPPAPYPTAGCL